MNRFGVCLLAGLLCLAGPAPAASPAGGGGSGAPKGVLSAPSPEKELAPSDTPKYTGELITLDFQDAPVRQILQLLADFSDNNIVISEEVTGNVTLRLNEVPWDQAMDIVLSMNSLGMIQEGNIIRVSTLDLLAQQAAQEAAAETATVESEDLVTRFVPVHFSTASNMAEMIREQGNILSERGKIVSDERTNTLIVRDIESAIDQVQDLIKILDEPTRQVSIEARIVQVQPTYKKELGVQWGGGVSYNAATSFVRGQGTAPTDGNVPAFGAFLPGYVVNMPAALAQAGTGGSVGINFGRLIGTPVSLDLRLSAGEVQGLTKIISTPKVTVLDNQEAFIGQGESIPYQTVSDQGTNTIFQDADLSLKVTPHITDTGMITLNVEVSKNSVGSVTNAGLSIIKREASTRVLLRDGETTVIGGIYEHSRSNTEQRVPYFHRIPFLGWLFRKNFQDENRSELLVFITPRVVR